MLKLLLLFILFIAVNGYTQTLIMNEVSQGEMGNMEYVEFVVIDTTVIYDCSSGVPPSIDIRGWIFDDNNGYHGPNGIAIGAIRFSFDPMWSTVPLGTIILIYNDADPNPEVPVIDVSMSDGNCQIVAPISDANLFESNATTPGAVACSYPAAGWVPGGNWSNTVLRNGGDCARIVDLAGCEVFSVCWGDVNLNTLIYFGGSATNTVYYFNNIDPNNQLNWSSGCADLPNCGTQDQTPGAPNNAANALYIASFNNSCTPIPPIVASAVVDNDELCSCDGQATASAVGSIPGYSYQWYDNSFVAIGQTSATATGLCPGTYNVIVTSSINCSDTATVTIVAGVPLNVTAINSGASCVGDTVVMNETGGDAISWSWASNGSASIINPSDQSPMVIGAVNGELFTVIITNVFGCTDSAQTTLTVNSLPVVSSFNSGPYCFGDAMDVSESGGSAISWLWTSNGAATITNDTDQNPVVTGVVDGEIFTVTGTDANGCSNAGTTTLAVNNPVLLDQLADVEECNTYSLPVITGGDLTGNQAYYDNSQTNFGAVINGPITSSQTVWVYDGSGSCADEISFYVTINDCEIVVPTAFTPDSDQYNDDWEILGLDEAHPSNKVFIYNRWGSLLFESPQGAYDSYRWDGTYNGRKLPVGSYYYIIEFNDDVTSALSGTVSIILN